MQWIIKFHINVVSVLHVNNLVWICNADWIPTYSGLTFNECDCYILGWLGNVNYNNNSTIKNKYIVFFISLSTNSCDILLSHCSTEEVLKKIHQPR